jgi:16S rRNA processing protein RimM
MSERIALGIIRKAHGVRGEASVEPWTDSLERFAELKSVTLLSPDESHARETAIESVREHAGRVLIKFAGYDSPESLRDVQNWTLEIPETEARSLDEDEYFLHDLVGLTLFDREGRDRGTVADVLEGGGGLLLTVKRADGKTYDLPFAAELCVEIDLPGRRIVVELPEGIDDLDSVEE